jgi:GMP synthase (glutamine-hydrolysing)
MEDILVFQHDPFDGLGFFADILEKQNRSFRIVRLFHGEMAHQDWDHVRALLILGGPMRTCEEERYPFLRWEKTIIRAAMKESLPMLGLCLGAQLIAEALGANVYRGALHEIGWYPISITPHGQVDSLLGHLPQNASVFQWHADGFALPAGALRLAASAHYENQAFRVGKNVYGLQFHLEVTPPMIERWMDEHSKDLAQVPYITPDKIRADTQIYAPRLKYYGERFLAEFLRRASSVKRRNDDSPQAKT